MASQPPITLTPERFAQGMTFEQYLEYIGSPENLQREGSFGATRRDWTAYLRERYQRTQLSEAQAAAFRALTALPNGPGHILMIAEDWSTDVRRDLGTVQRLAEAGGIDLRIFTRDDHRWVGGSTPYPDSPNADLVTPFLRRRGDETFLSIPVVAFFTRDFQYLYHYQEWPAVYHKDRIRGHQSTARPGESAEAAQRRSTEEYAAMVGAPIFDVWTSAAASEMISLLFERLVVGSLE
jgi:hypothetical protein